MTNVTLPPVSSAAVLAQLVQAAAAADGNGAAGGQGNALPLLTLPAPPPSSTLAQAMLNQGALTVQNINVSAGGQVSLSFSNASLPQMVFQLPPDQAPLLLAIIDSGRNLVMVNTGTDAASSANWVLQPVGSDGAGGNNAAPPTALASPELVTTATNAGAQPAVLLDIRTPTILAWPAPAALLQSLPSLSLPSLPVSAVRATPDASGLLASVQEATVQGETAPPLPQTPSLFTLVGPGGNNSASAAPVTAVVTTQLANQLTAIKIGPQFWLTNALPNVAAGTSLSLVFSGPAAPTALEAVFGKAPLALQGGQGLPMTPELAALVQAAMPQALANPAMAMEIRAGSMLFLLLAALQGGVPERLLRTDVQMMADLPEMLRLAMTQTLQRWQAEVTSGEGSFVADQAGHFWQYAQLPGPPFVWPLPLQVLIQRSQSYAHGEGAEAKERRNKGRKVRFLIDVRFSHFGQTQFDGLTDASHLDLAIRSEQRLAPSLQQSLMARYGELVEACGFTGRLAFYDGAGALLAWQRRAAATTLQV